MADWRAPAKTVPGNEMNEHAERGNFKKDTG